MTFTSRNGKFRKSDPTQAINLLYIRAAIEANCGVRLPLEDIQRLLVEEGLVTPAQMREHAQVFRGYAEFYEYDDELSVDASLPDALFPMNED